MAKRRVGQKAQRVLEFLVGLGHRRAREALDGCGFTEEDLDDGWERLRALSKVTPRETATSNLNIVDELDAWENRWYPTIDLVLRTNFPDVHAIVFRNLKQTEGVELIAYITALLDRLELLARPESEGGLGEQGSAARALLAKRKVTDEVIAEGRALLARVGAEPEDITLDELEVLDRQARGAAEQHMWSWYLEWSGLARINIADRRVLRLLGFLRGGEKGGEDE